MQSRVTDPVQDVSFGTALNISLNNYYDLLKAQVGGLAAEEFLQLKMVADPVDINDDNASKGGYRWWSYYNLLQRSDLSISPTPVANQVQTSAVALHIVYGDFLDRLIKYVAITNLSQADQKTLADLQVTLKSLREQNQKLASDDIARWKIYADTMGYAYGDWGQYANWESLNGNSTEIAANNDAIKQAFLDRKIILNKQYPDPEDKRIKEASNSFDNMMMQIGYPIFPDYRYSDGDMFSVGYLSQRAGSSTGLFDSRRVIAWNQTLKSILTTTAGGFAATFDKTTGISKSIEQDWGVSGSGSYDFISASGSASEHTAIQEDFTKGTKIELGATAAFRLDISYADWFQPVLFTCKHVTENPSDFVEFFGAKGSLLYYPTALILIRGFSVAFESTEDWKYDYDHRFSASAGGGFSAFGVSFGASGSYTEHTHEHQVDQSKTTLTFKDDPATIRFVGYAVAKNVAFAKSYSDQLTKTFGKIKP